MCLKVDHWHLIGDAVYDVIFHINQLIVRFAFDLLRVFQKTVGFSVILEDEKLVKWNLRLSSTHFFIQLPAIV